MSGPTLCRNSLNSPADVTNSPSLSGRRHGLSMERLKSAVPPDLRRAVGEGTAADLANTTSRLFAFFDSLPLFHQVTTATLPFSLSIPLYPRRPELGC
jgi:hypothetical protein